MGCELHSNLVSLHSETTAKKSPRRSWKLWITFKSCIFAFWNNRAFLGSICSTVVNYIQILYLCILKQPEQMNRQARLSCELHSNLVSLHSETTYCSRAITARLLWITFKSCIFAFWNNQIILFRSSRQVVNYIQILYLCILKQPTLESLKQLKSCELHSNLVSLHSETTIRHFVITELGVVNYIQILYLCILKQQLASQVPRRLCCELHSNLVSLHSETTHPR